MQAGLRSTSTPAARTTTTSPRRRSRRSAAHSARRARRTGTGVRSTKGDRVKVVLADYGAGNLRSVCAALERAGAEPVSRPTRPRARGAARGDRRRRPRRERRPRPRSRAASTTRCGSARPPAGRCSASASACSSCSRRARRAARGLGLLRGPVDGSARRVPHMGWNTLAPDAAVGAARRARRRATSTSPTASRPSRPSRSRSPRSSTRPVVAAVERGAVAGVQFHPERSGAAGARVLENALAWSRSA